MKAAGATGEEVVQKLVTHSATFSGKTGFSQEKYVRKKLGKHLRPMQILPASPTNVCTARLAKGGFPAGRMRRRGVTSGED